MLGGLSNGHGACGVLSSGTVYAGYAPAGSLELTEHGRTLERQPVFGWAAQFSTASAGSATLAVRRAPYVPMSVTLEVLVWVALAAAVLGWPRPLGRRTAERTEP